jgi:hypothetical protein
MVAKPWGDSSRCDFVLDSEEKLLRVQVKSTSCVCDGWYAIAAHGCDASAGFLSRRHAAYYHLRLSII